MKKLIGLFLAMVLSSQAFAMSEIEKVSALSSELALLNIQLENAQADRQDDIVKLSISLVAAGFLAGSAYEKTRTINAGVVRGIFPAYDAHTNIRHQYMAAAAAGAYAGIKIFSLKINYKQIPELKELIAQKQKELAAASAVLQSLED